MELGDLRAFLAVAEELSFTRAADRLNVTQPPLTRLISRLEGRLGAPLFERTTRRVRLTAAGRLLVGEAREVLARADAARRRLRDATAARSPWLGVGYTQVALYTALPRLVERLGAISPDRELRLREASTRRQVEALEAAEIDLGLLHLPVRSAHLETRVVHTERVRLAVPAHHPLAGRPGLGLADFAGESLIVHPPHEDPAMHEDILRACAAAGFAPRLRREARHETCTGLVLSGQGVHPVAAGCACLRPKGVVHLDLEGPTPAISVALAWRRGAVPAGTIEALLGPGRAG
jgi:DNA-binding transcriptional LysR family regulator